MGKDGQVSQSVALPDDVLASGEEMQRDLRAITINNGSRTRNDYK